MADPGTFQRHLLSRHHRPATLAAVPPCHALLGTAHVTAPAELFHLVFQETGSNHLADLNRQVMEAFFQQSHDFILVQFGQHLLTC